MANTTNLDLVKPLGTDHALVAQINSNSDKIDAEAGRTRANFAAEYSASSAYAVGAFCTHNGILYQCNTAIGSGGEAWTAAHWTQISAAAAVTANTQAIAGIKNATQITGSTKSAVESSLETFGSAMSNGEIRRIWFGILTASEPFMGTTYVGTIERQENRFIVLVNGISAVGQDLEGFYKSGTGWAWQSLNKTSDSYESGTILASKVGNVVTITIVALAVGTKSGVLGSAYRPSATARGTVVNESGSAVGRLTINTSGDVSISASTSTSYYGSVTYII